MKKYNIKYNFKTMLDYKDTFDQWDEKFEKLKKNDPKQAIELLKVSIRDNHHIIRYKAYIKLKDLKEKEFDIYLLHGLSDSFSLNRSQVIEFLIQKNKLKFLPFIIRSIKDKDFQIRTSVINILENCSHKELTITFENVKKKFPDDFELILEALNIHGIKIPEIYFTSLKKKRNNCLKTSSVKWITMTTRQAYHSYYKELTSTNPEGMVFYHSDVKQIKDKLGPYALSYLTPRGLILSSRWPVINNRPWVLSSDDFILFWTLRGQENYDVQYGKLSYNVPPILDNDKADHLKHMVKLLKSRNCKAILPWSKWALKYFKNYISSDSKIIEKMHVLYPAVVLPDTWNKPHEGINILFCGRNFVRKGGEDTIKIFHFLKRKRKKIKLIIISNVPKDVQEKHLKDKDIIFVGNIPRESISEYYKISDIFVLPTKLDSWGMVFVEAMSYGLPIITTTGRRLPVSKEIINEGENGFLIERVGSDETPTQKDGQLNFEGNIDLDLFVEKIELLCGDIRLRKKISQENRKVVKTGRFSILERDKKFKKIISSF